MAKSTPRLHLVPSLDTQGIPEPWNTSLQRLDCPTPRLPLVYPSPPLEPRTTQIAAPALIQQRLDMEEADWRIALYWVVKKKWKPKLKIPLKRAAANLYQPWGELFYRGLELCIECHRLSPSSHTLYLSDAFWYECVMQEAKHISMRAIVANEPTGKSSSVEERYDIIKALKALTNPANPRTSPHFHRLMEVALTLEHQDAFNDRYWKPFLRASSQWTQLTASRSCQETFVEGNKLVQRCGQGRGTITLLRVP